jgi:hypothetical protein
MQVRDSVEDRVHGDIYSLNKCLLSTYIPSTVKSWDVKLKGKYSMHSNLFKSCEYPLMSEAAFTEQS